MSTEVLTIFPDEPKKGDSAARRRPPTPLTYFLASLLVKEFSKQPGYEQKLLAAEVAAPEAANKRQLQQQFQQLRQFAENLFQHTETNKGFNLQQLLGSVEALGQQFLSSLHRNRLQTCRPDLNPISWHAQAQEIIRQHNHPESSQAAIQEMLLQDLEYFMREQLLKQLQSSIDYQILEQGSTSSGYRHSNLAALCQHLLQQKQSEKPEAPLSRTGLDNLIFGEFLSGWLATASIGQRLAIISPPGEKADGYMGLDGYSFVFVYHVLPAEGGGKKARVDMFKLYLHPDNSQEVLSTLAEDSSGVNPNLATLLSKKKRRGKKFQQHFNQQLLLSPIVINPHLSDQEISQFLRQFSRNTPKKQQEKIVSPLFWQDFRSVFEQFFWPQVQQILQASSLEQKQVLVFEEALNFFQRAMLNQTAQKQSDYHNMSAEQIEQLLASFRIYLQTKIEQQPLSQSGLENYNSLLSSVFANLIGAGGGGGALGQMMSLTSCGIGTLPSLMLKSGQQFSAGGPALAPPLDRLGAVANYRCPLCQQSIADPCYCPRCSPLLNNQQVEQEALNINSTQSRLSAARPALKNNPVAGAETQGFTQFFSTLLGPQQSVSLMNLLAEG